MNAEKTIAALLARAGEAANADRRTRARQKARRAWVAEFVARFDAAHAAVDAAWDRRLDALDHLDDAEIERIDFPELPEEAALNALMAEVEAVRDHDHWPKGLYWGGI